MVFREVGSAIKRLDNFLGNVPCFSIHAMHTNYLPPEYLSVKLMNVSSTCQKDGAAATGGQAATPSASAAPQGLDALLGGLLGSGAPKQPSSAAPAAATKRP